MTLGPMRNGVIALLVSLAVHGVIAVAAGWCLDWGGELEAMVQLDLTSVELSFAPNVDDAAAAATPSSVCQPVPAAQESDSRPKREDALPAAAAEVPRPQAKPPEAEPSPVPEPHEAIAQLTLVSQPSAPRQARIDAPPKLRRNIRFDYPRESRRRGEQGDVVLEFEVAADGTVSSARVVGSPGFPRLEEAALKAVREAHFVPAVAEGKAVSSSARLTLNFRLK